MTDVKGSILGNSVLRKEDPRLLSGGDRYYDDLDASGVGYVHFVRSPYAHADLGSIDTSEAEEMPGVLGVYTADNLDMTPFLGFAMYPPHVARPPLAKGKVRLVGDIVAAVVASSRAEAEDAAEAVVVDYQLPIVHIFKL